MTPDRETVIRLAREAFEYPTGPRLDPMLSGEQIEKFAALLLEHYKPKPLTEEKIEEAARPFVRSLGGDHWSRGEEGIALYEDFARAIEKAHGIKGDAT